MKNSSNTRGPRWFTLFPQTAELMTQSFSIAVAVWTAITCVLHLSLELTLSVPHALKARGLCQKTRSLRALTRVKPKLRPIGVRKQTAAWISRSCSWLQSSESQLASVLACCHVWDEQCIHVSLISLYSYYTLVSVYFYFDISHWYSWIFCTWCALTMTVMRDGMNPS